MVSLNIHTVGFFFLVKHTVGFNHPKIFLRHFVPKIFCIHAISLCSQLFIDGGDVAMPHVYVQRHGIATLIFTTLTWIFWWKVIWSSLIVLVEIHSQF